MTDTEKMDKIMSEELRARKDAELRAEQELHQFKLKNARASEAQAAKARGSLNENVAADKLAKRRINAEEAKAIADSSIVVLSRIYKIIREEAEEGRVKLVWGIDNMSKTCIANIKANLEADGYTVSGETSDDLTIQW